MKRLKQRVLTDEGDLRKGLSIVYARDDMGISSGKKEVNQPCALRGVHTGKK